MTATTTCDLQTIRDGIVDAMMRHTPVYHDFVLDQEEAGVEISAHPLRFSVMSGNYVLEAYGDSAKPEICRVCALGTLLCSHLSSVSLDRVLKSDYVRSWSEIPEQISCFDATTLMTLECLFEADDPYGRSAWYQYPDGTRNETLRIWCELTEHTYRQDETGKVLSPGCTNSTVAKLPSATEYGNKSRLFACFQYLLEKDGKLVPEDMRDFSNLATLDGLVTRGLATAEAATEAYIAKQRHAK